MGKKPTEGQWKLVEFDAPTWHALNLLSREPIKSFQELADEAALTAPRDSFSQATQAGSESRSAAICCPTVVCSLER
jgi:hypothetical protein